ncbi:3-hydroxyisobutyrate dehydrogenase [Mycobacteroides abscessus]
MATYGWIGLGNMGGPMTANLVAAGHTVRGFDLSGDALAAAETTGVTVVEEIAEVLAGAEVVFTMLPKGEHVRSVLEGPYGIWENASPSTLLVDSSTVDIETSRYCHAESARRGFRFVDAPVSGGISGAQAATLCFMLGGELENVGAATDYIKPMAGRVIHAGDGGAGVAAKICNNMMLFIDMMANSEGSQLAERLGLDPQVFWEICSVSSARSWAQQTWYPVPGIIESAAANRNFDATFTVDLAHKDARLALAAGEATGVNLPAATLVTEQFQQLIDEGLGGKDCSLIVKYATPDGSPRGYTP